MFDAVAVEAARFLRKAEDKHEAMKCLPESTGTSIFRKGVKLGRQLEEMEDDKRWKVLADFWAEMLLYVTPSDNVKEHIEFLANGGEFLTHLWALLTHAGILDRDQRNVLDIENAETSGQPSFSWTGITIQQPMYNPGYPGHLCRKSIGNYRDDGPTTGKLGAKCGRNSQCKSTAPRVIE